MRTTSPTKQASLADLNFTSYIDLLTRGPCMCIPEGFERQINRQVCWSAVIHSKLILQPTRLYTV